MMGELAALAIEEEKNEVDDGGSDSSTQADLSYDRFWAQLNVLRAFKSSSVYSAAPTKDKPKFKRI